MKHLAVFMWVILGIFSLFACSGLNNGGISSAVTNGISTQVSNTMIGPGKATSAMRPAATGQHLAAGQNPPTDQPPASNQESGQVDISAVGLASSMGDFSAPVIDGLSIQPGQQAGSAEYLDSRGRRVLLVEALSLNDNSEHSVQLKQLLEEIYGPSSPYVISGVYPRFRFPQPGVQAGFFAVDANLTASQVLLLRDALDLFGRPVFAAMQPDLFDPGMAYVLIDKISGDTAGLTFAGTGVVELDRRDLFGNKYLLASVIAHEGSHVLQGPETSDAGCTEHLKREVGDRTIPADFYQWDAAALLQAIKDRQIGAYHVTLWMLTRLGVKNTGWVVQAIKTGMVGGNSVVNCKL
jgi:hypothetical protein